MDRITLQSLLKISDPTEYKFHCARWNGESQPLDVYVEDKNSWFRWNTWRSSKNEFTRKYIFSLIDFYPENNIWLFGGIYEVLERPNVPNTHSYKIRELTEYANYVGRLKVYLPKPSRGRAFYLERYIDQMVVSELLKAPYSGEYFPGYENINHDFSALLPIFKNQKADWKSALSNVKGVYVIFDKSNGKKYVGSAYGEHGIWSRWGCYIGTGHGWNDGLTDLISQNGFDYALKNFKITLLEYRPMKTDDSTIIERESYWKEVLLSRNAFGYNKN
ncbi:GIY-YIG nuclease family protein [Vibrio parahaemolyticus]|nr:GIY-YIG nuclease family protein [Vibrio parahaemolyticus]EJG1998040.1 GIY-YIG nuclease family protein [Vibrio parahaemolyticus]